MLLGMQDFYFAKVLPKFAQIFWIIIQNLVKFIQILPKSAEILPKQIC